MFVDLECVLLEGLLHSSSGMAVRKRWSTRVSAPAEEALALGTTQVPPERTAIWKRPDDSRHLYPRSKFTRPRLWSPRTRIFIYPATEKWIWFGNLGPKTPRGFKGEPFVLKIQTLDTVGYHEWDSEMNSYRWLCHMTVIQC